ncbi:hypothetical protein C1Y63_04600 [Corynebacterium sp. 13CS0277]|uniref:hypothetical protein n=1 Tax=Corynebacterium sp. 13CS0277 TaxID=2071994 RepID=UPI000D0294E5|nr:hypothetical protein [Corynebacterium sp. 13CS0277]PRQ11692.1 hypothetical protein C1Y63_04600 [Corynebacterium sp. 13CS0277]
MSTATTTRPRATMSARTRRAHGPAAYRGQSASPAGAPSTSCTHTGSTRAVPGMWSRLRNARAAHAELTAPTPTQVPITLDAQQRYGLLQALKKTARQRGRTPGRRWAGPQAWWLPAPAQRFQRLRFATNRCRHRDTSGLVANAFAPPYVFPGRAELTPQRRFFRYGTRGWAGTYLLNRVHEHAFELNTEVFLMEVLDHVTRCAEALSFLVPGDDEELEAQIDVLRRMLPLDGDGGEEEWDEEDDWGDLAAEADTHRGTEDAAGWVTDWAATVYGDGRAPLLDEDDEDWDEDDEDWEEEFDEELEDDDDDTVSDAAFALVLQRVLAETRLNSLRLSRQLRPVLGDRAKVFARRQLLEPCPCPQHTLQALTHTPEDYYSWRFLLNALGFDATRRAHARIR